MRSNLEISKEYNVFSERNDTDIKAMQLVAQRLILEVLLDIRDAVNKVPGVT